jgi:hypothetical protein
VGLTLTAVPLVTVRLPGVITPVPLAKTAVRLALPPTVIVAGFASKLVIVGAGTTVTVAVAVTAAPLVGVTVRVYSVVVAGLTLTPVPLVTARFPGVITPVPFTNTPVNVALAPAVMVVGFATKLEMEATGGGALDEPPPQPARPPKHKLTAKAHATRTEIRPISFPV